MVLFCLLVFKKKKTLLLFNSVLQDQVKATIKAMVATMDRIMEVMEMATARVIMITLGMTIQATTTKIMAMDKAMMITMVSHKILYPC